MTEGRNYAQYILGADPRVSTATTTSTTTTTLAPSTTTTTTLAVRPCARLSCEEAGTSRLDLRFKQTGTILRSAWRQGGAVSPADLGNPLAGGDTGYSICLGHGSGTLLFERYLPPGAPWKTAKNGLQYAGGGLSLAVTPGAAGRSRLLLAIKQLQLPMQSVLPLTVQVEADTGACWASSYAASDVKTNRSRRLIAVTHTPVGGLNPFVHPFFGHRRRE
jgi:hypothetical protein